MADVPHQHPGDERSSYYLDQLFMIGVCGGYTTFSSFSLQTLDLARDGDWLKALLNTGLSFGCCLAAVWLGRVLALALLPK